jgi:hypothetical protein
MKSNKKILFLMCLLVGTLMFIPNGLGWLGDPEYIWTENFESYQGSQTYFEENWTITEEGNGVIELSSTQKYNGSYSLHISSDPGDPPSPTQANATSPEVLEDYPTAHTFYDMDEYHIRTFFWVADESCYDLVVMYNYQIHLTVESVPLEPLYEYWLVAHSPELEGGKTPISRISPETWHDITFKAYPITNRTYDVYINGETTEYSTAIPFDEDNGIDHRASKYLYLGDLTDSIDDYGEAYWDYMYLYGVIIAEV